MLVLILRAAVMVDWNSWLVKRRQVHIDPGRSTIVVGFQETLEKETNVLEYT